MNELGYAEETDGMDEWYGMMGHGEVTKCATWNEYVTARWFVLFFGLFAFVFVCLCSVCVWCCFWFLFLVSWCFAWFSR